MRVILETEKRKKFPNGNIDIVTLRDTEIFDKAAYLQGRGGEMRGGDTTTFRPYGKICERNRLV